MGLLSRCALIGIPAKASPVEETTFPARSDAPSAASASLDGPKAQTPAIARAVNAVPMVSLAFIVVTFLRDGVTQAEFPITPVRDRRYACHRKATRCAGDNE